MKQTKLTFTARSSPRSQSADAPGSPISTSGREKRPRERSTDAPPPPPSPLPAKRPRTPARVPQRPLQFRARKPQVAVKERLMFSKGMVVRVEPKREDGVVAEGAESVPPPPPKPKSSKPRPSIHVVDKHHDVLRPIFGQMQAGVVPTTGLTLVHFDSHPDMAPLPQNTPKTLLAGMQQGNYDTTHLHSKCDIASWILPLVMAGHVKEVVWLCGWWCHQMDPGTYHLQIGLHKNEMKLAAEVEDTRTHDGCGLYWASAGAWTEADKLKDARPWKLHVCRMQKSGRFAERDVQLLHRVTRACPWALDFDEDFMSCSNPFQEEFLSFFGKANYETLRATYDPLYDTASHWERLQSLIHRGIYRDERQKFRQHPTFRKLLDNTPEELLLKFHELCNGLHAKTEGRWTMADIYSPILLHSTGETTGLPHHITKLEDLVRIANTLQQLLDGLSDPVIVTIATSRADKYLPDSQATRIHQAICQLLGKQYGTALKDIFRLDKAEFSVPLRV
eukprot:GGOE01022852.1.p1 GENE.GGOE01022852.1~~GGOE01022852.1.p1  ORF type:complete len:505 (-),score=172.56 GGOE01022852.1:310-1824(-)